MCVCVCNVGPTDTIDQTMRNDKAVAMHVVEQYRRCGDRAAGIPMLQGGPDYAKSGPYRQHVDGNVCVLHNRWSGKTILHQVGQNAKMSISP